MENQHNNRQKRSSLKNSTPLNVNDFAKIQHKNKRNSVSWNVNTNMDIKEIKPIFHVDNGEDKGRKMSDFGVQSNILHKKFEEARKRSIKNEFSFAKELLKNKPLVEEIDQENLEEIKVNTEKNKEVGKLVDDKNSNSENSDENM